MEKRERATSMERQLVVFRLASQVYGVDIGSVREILRMQQITHVPHAPEFVEGVINLRGKICP
ncbi:MAG: chemotaxis protein CheW, partial [Chloroflexi bacterium]|nr:chemotaxis protein CheW [Chloroflexota bacterium]